MSEFGNFIVKNRLAQSIKKDRDSFPDSPILAFIVRELTMLKQCCTCKEKKPLEDFCKRYNGEFGRDHKCKQCSLEYRQKNRRKLSLMAYEWNKANKEKWQAGIKKWLNKNPEKRLRYQRNTIEKHRDRFRARCRFIMAVKKGKIKRGDCVICNAPNAQGHHEDYAKPFDVIWLCRKHHQELHYTKKEVLKNYSISCVQAKTASHNSAYSEREL